MILVFEEVIFSFHLSFVFNGLFYMYIHFLYFFLAEKYRSDIALCIIKICMLLNHISYTYLYFLFLNCSMLFGFLGMVIEQYREF